MVFRIGAISAFSVIFSAVHVSRMFYTHFFPPRNLTLFFSLNVFKEIIADLQCFVNFSCAGNKPRIIYIYSSSHTVFHHRKRLDIVPCAIQQDLIAYPLQMQSFTCCHSHIPAILTASTGLSTNCSGPEYKKS